MLLNVSLKAKYYDRKINFRIVKHCFSSYVEISFPAHLLVDANVDDLEGGVELGLGGADKMDFATTSSAAPAAFSVVAPGGPPFGNRLKDS